MDSSNGEPKTQECIAYTLKTGKPCGIELDIHTYV
jgi:hypothetical protein